MRPEPCSGSLPILTLPSLRLKQLTKGRYGSLILTFFHLNKNPMQRQSSNRKKIKFLQLATYHMVEEMAPLWCSGYLDPGWENGIAQDERKTKVKCNYCGKMVSGGIFRLKQHLVRLTGDGTHCEKVLEDVCL